METFLGIMIPFLGTALGSACVFFMKKSLGDLVQRALAGFAAGVMVAASIWSLLIPAIEQSEDMGKLSFLPAFIGFWIGVLFLLMLDRLIPHLHVGSNQAEGPKSRLGRTTMMVLAVTLHNIPEGMAIGVMYAGFLAGNAQITAASALVLSLGIAIQNFPEGAIISMPLRAEGESKGRAFLGGVLSGVVEPIGAVLTLLARLLAAPLAKLFVGYDEGLYTLTCHAFRLFSFAFLFAGFNIFASSFFTALGNGLISAAISFLRTLVFQTASVLILPLIFDVDGIWYAITVAEVFATLISVIFLFAKRKKYHYMECSPHGKK